MKNKFLFISFIFIFFYQSFGFAEVFNIESSEIKILEKGNIIKAVNGVKITSNDGIEIRGKELIYNKKDSILKIIGDVELNDKENNIITEGD